LRTRRHVHHNGLAKDQALNEVRNGDRHPEFVAYASDEGLDKVRRDAPVVRDGRGDEMSVRFVFDCRSVWRCTS